MIRLMKRSVCVMVSLSLAGCLGLSPSTMKPAVNQPDLNLATSFSYEHSAYGVQWRFTLAAGAYRAFRQDDGGIYFLGAPQCLSQVVIKSPVSQEYVNKLQQTVDCGVYVPSAVSASPQLFALVGTEVEYRPDGKLKNAQPSKGASTDAAGIAVQTAPGAAPLLIGAGAGLGSALGGAMLESQRGNIRVHWAPPPEPGFREWLRSATRS